MEAGAPKASQLARRLGEFVRDNGGGIVGDFRVRAMGDKQGAEVRFILRLQNGSREVVGDCRVVSRDGADIFFGLTVHHESNESLVGLTRSFLREGLKDVPMGAHINFVSGVMIGGRRLIERPR